MCWTCRERHPRQQGKGATPADFQQSHKCPVSQLLSLALEEATHGTQAYVGEEMAAHKLTGASVVPKHLLSHSETESAQPQEGALRAELSLCFHNKAMWYPQPQKQPPQTRRWEVGVPAETAHNSAKLWSCKRLPNVNKAQTSTLRSAPHTVPL